MTSRHKRVVGVTGVFALAQLVLVCSGCADNGALCDDAFYYFQIAKHAAAGRGFSFDGVHATNGFHPLLAWLSVPVFAVFDQPWLPVRIVIAMLALATAATGYVLYRVGRAIGEERGGELMTLLFLLSPYTWILPLRGCEGALVVLCVALATWQAARTREFDAGAAAKLGALVGLCGLARTETIFFAIGMFAWLGMRTRQPRALLAFVAAAVLVVSPWLVWNLARFGTIIQVSGAAKAAFHHYHPLPFGIRHLPANIYDVFRHPAQFVVGEEMLPRRWTDVLTVANAAIMAVAVVAGGGRRVSSLLLPVGALVVFHIAYYVLVQRAYFNWYFMPIVLGAAMLQGERMSRAPGRVAAGIVVASGIACTLALSCFYVRYPRWPHASEQQVKLALAAVEELPPSARAGLWNAGAVGYFGTIRRPDVTIYNLDCVVNNELFDAWKHGDYTRWVVENIDWLLEKPWGPLDRSIVVPVHDVLSRIAR